MGRVAIVTGGTRGLGEAIPVALQEAGNRVAAVYHNNEEAAAAFADRHRIPVFCWDVGDFDACARGVAGVDRALGPVNILVNNAGVTRDAMLHRMTPEQWSAVLHTNLGSMFNIARSRCRLH
ncbi:SDR family NAD(P)-dependent oxidoreductase [Massilia dura]|uniref:SDR family NAD(P)-dependent oxidoreductase n=1 Tax=Pseudoduganella dura TaxID=321982 RepID=A0A6I3XDY9_9BURK|nr:SDR family NAD(P)-dependent oxidoreductase [Pseudoduganella dura]MUI11442.1 SDR family NAD(P)-dependent oxidoreductase [Pseudoduganella dura]GGX97706.1 hypothetical protein GCM10007386_30880 [Pseudoduganella dura]